MTLGSRCLGEIKSGSHSSGGLIEFVTWETVDVKMENRVDWCRKSKAKLGNKDELTGFFNPPSVLSVWGYSWIFSACVGVRVSVLVVGRDKPMEYWCP